MGQRSTKLRRGDFVEVKAPDEILQTLDAEGASDHLPFEHGEVFLARRSSG